MTLVPGPHCQASTWALEGGGGVWGGGCCWHGFAGGHVGDPSPLKGAPICLLGASLARASHLGHAGSRAILSGRGAGTRAMGKMAADVRGEKPYLPSAESITETTFLFLVT